MLGTYINAVNHEPIGLRGRQEASACALGPLSAPARILPAPLCVFFPQGSNAGCCRARLAGRCVQVPCVRPSELSLVLKRPQPGLDHAADLRGRAMAHSVLLFRTKTGPAWGSERGREKGAAAGSSWGNADPFRGHLLFQIAEEGGDPPPSPGYLGTGVLGQAERERGPGLFFPSVFPSAFLPHSFVPPARTALLHSPRSTIHAPAGSFIPGRRPSPPRLPSARGAPRPQACPSVQIGRASCRERV